MSRRKNLRRKFANDARRSQGTICTVSHSTGDPRESNPHADDANVLVETPPVAEVEAEAEGDCCTDNDERTGIRFRPFPVGCLPGPVREFVVGSAQALDCDESQVALPVLATLAAAIGNTRAIQLSEAWMEPAILWTAVVSESGTRKSPTVRAATWPLRERQQAAATWYHERHAQYRLDMATYPTRVCQAIDQELEHPTRPVPPMESRYMVSDASFEKLAEMLQTLPRGLLLCQDELNTWLKGFDRADQRSSRWLELHGAGSVLIEQGSGRRIDVPCASVSITGGIQPEILAGRLKQPSQSSGLFARLLFAFPQSRPRRWRDASVINDVTEPYYDVVNQLLAIPLIRGPYGGPLQSPVKLSVEARQRFIQFVQEFGEVQNEAEPGLVASFAKFLEGYAARLALIAIRN